MSKVSKHDIVSILDRGQDLTIATLRPDGWPQATTVSYASDGLAIYIGCGAQSQKAHNLADDDRVSLTVNLPYSDWTQIRGLSLAGRARRLPEGDELEHAGELFMRKFPEAAQYAVTLPEEIAMYRITPEVISLLDYGKGFGHTETVRVSGALGETRLERLRV